MTIQIPNPGTGNGATGDNEYVLWSKVKDNFENQSHAASRLVGKQQDNLAQYVIADGLSGYGYGGSIPTIRDTNTDNLSNNPIVGALGLPSGFYYLHSSCTGNAAAKFVLHNAYGTGNIRGWRLLNTPFTPELLVQTSDSAGAWGAANKLYTTANTTKDSNGFLKAASPIVKVFADKIELNQDAIDQNVAFTKNGVGDYTITTVSGLSTDGWYLELPKDLNGNPKVAVTLSETDGVISLKSYKRIFSMETFTFTPDLDYPLDIPDGRWIDLRLNEIETHEVLPEV